MLHLTAKSTQFGKKTFTSWLIEAAGTVPIQRRKDFAEGVIDNGASMEKMSQVRIKFRRQYEVILRRVFVDLRDGWRRVSFSGGGE